MTNSNGNGAASNGAASNGAMPPLGVTTAKFDTTAMTTFWMSGSARLMRSSEIFMRGMTAVARLEAELGQQVLQRGMAAFRMPGLGVKPEELARTQIDQTMLDVESLMTTMRSIADEFRHTINDSTQALFDVPSTAPEPSFAASIHIEDPVPRRRPAPGATFGGTVGTTQTTAG